MTAWSRVVATPDEARAALADPGDALDLRAAVPPAPAPRDPGWQALGFQEVAPGELALPVPQRLADLAQTRSLGARLAAGLRAGDLVVLTGPLGAGKTSLTQGIGQALGVRGAVTSPTFVLVRTHRGPVPLVHVDAYRLKDSGALDLDDLDLDDDLPHAVTVVEWGEGVVEQLSPDRLHVVLERGGGTTQTGTDHRTARVIAVGARWSVVQRP